MASPTHFGQQPRSRDLLQSPSPARSLLNATFPHALASGGFGAGLLPVHIAVTKGIPVGFFSSAYLLLKFSGFISSDLRST
ncbi:hypothetical protein JTE90_007604 [Oedothorax gibbosus]|uniref:Uncharacterized protein n=1 Tax=Oedothorax gibbosus TaxID=931172 RepID=A0AAV6TIM3_9ARAC|nr:hypothetical protein JTE90_007604 [Oedothorax gibbosus]